MLSEIKEPGPGFEYFLNTPCQSWDAIQYHEAWKNNNLVLDKAIVTRSFNKQIQKIKEHGSEEERKNAIHHIQWLPMELHFRMVMDYVSVTTATHGTTSSHGYELRLRCWLQLPMKLCLHMIMDYVSAIEYKKMGCIDNFWLKSFPELKRRDLMENEKINAKNVFLSCDLSCDGVQFGGTGNIIQGYKRSRGDRKVSVEVVIPTKRKELSPEINESFQNETASEKDETEFESQDSSSVISVCDDGDDSDYVTSDVDDQKSPPLLILSQLEDFHKFFTKMNKVQKWVLTSGKCVEDTIFKHCKELSIETYLHSWIIDLEDREAERLFTIEEWDEIKHEVQKLSEVDKTFAESMMRFANAKTTSELRQVLETTSFRNKDEPYDRQKHYDVEWADLVMKDLVHYKDPNEPLKKSHLESWYDINVWSLIVDRGLRNINGIEIVRAHARRKKVPRKKMGYKMDGIFRTYDNVEYRATEVGRKFDATKLLTDEFKLGKAMHDIFACLCKLVRFEENKIKKLRVADIIHLVIGLKLQVLQLSSPKGYISILKRDKFYEVPSTVEGIKDLIRVLASMWKVKKMIADCMDMVNTSIQESTDFLQEIIGTESPPPEIDFLWLLDSITM
ncbi:hypothetical protein Glove_115g92 [Diversispora epigaea]|uniref:Uncharacterized protein n=1 Tax=Diversispora epigaea TaxID=1348612 RepID=A0A397J9X4_9GLOM|nr:hypothetical protein Glove_115g92 [Diversispora epigaea]